MARFKMNVERTLNAFTSGTYKVQEALYEFVDNSVDAGTSEVMISAEKGEENPLERIIIADNGNGMTSDGLEDSLEFGANHRERHKHEVSEFGIGFKAAAFALAMQMTVVTKSCDGKISGAFLDRERINKEQLYEGPKDNPPRNYVSLWDEYSISDNTGTIVILESLIQKEYASCETFIGVQKPKGGKGIRKNSGLPTRYHHLINTQALKILTKNGKGTPKPIKACDPLYRDLEGVEKLIDATYSWDRFGAVFNTCITKLTDDLSGPRGFGIYVMVAGTVVYHDPDTLLGIYTEGTSHSHRWALRTEISFKDKNEFNKIFDFTSHKHDISAKVNFGDWLRDMAIGKIYSAEAARREKERKGERQLEVAESREKANDSFIQNLNERRELYGANQKLRDQFFGKVMDIKPGKFDDRFEISRYEDGTIFYNNVNPQISALFNTNDSILNHQARVLATASALVESLNDTQGFAVPIGDYTAFLVNLTALQT
jgi:hypothetical protein